MAEPLEAGDDDATAWATADEALPKPIELSFDEFEAMLDERCRRDLGMSLAEFRIKLKAGEIPDNARTGYFLVLAGDGEQ